MQAKFAIGMVCGLAVVAVGAAGVAFWDGQDAPVVPEPVAVAAMPQPTPRVVETRREPELERSEDWGRGGGEGGFADFEARLAEFDKDGDGTLSDEERRAMMEKFRADRMAQLDTNGDGEVDADERLDAMINSRRGRRLVDRFDADGDGMLDPEERQALKDDMARREAEREARRIDRYDTDGDGMLSEAEERAAAEQERRQREERFEQFTSQYDRDGDGELDADERHDAFTTMRDDREVRSFVRRFDSNRDGVIDTVDFNAFLALYQSGDNRADVNGDGSIDALDVTAFRDMMGRANAG